MHDTVAFSRCRRAKRALARRNACNAVVAIEDSKAVRKGRQGRGRLGGMGGISLTMIKQIDALYK